MGEMPPTGTPSGSRSRPNASAKPIPAHAGELGPPDRMGIPGEMGPPATEEATEPTETRDREDHPARTEIPDLGDDQDSQEMSFPETMPPADPPGATDAPDLLDPPADPGTLEDLEPPETVVSPETADAPEAPADPEMLDDPARTDSPVPEGAATTALPLVSPPDTRPHSDLFIIIIAFSSFILSPPAQD